MPECGTGRGTVSMALGGGPGVSIPEQPANRSGKPFQQKTPRRGGEALLGLLQGGEICISIYVDQWEVGGPLRVAGATSIGSR